jgi:hypothetical protein
MERLRLVACPVELVSSGEEEGEEEERPSTSFPVFVPGNGIPLSAGQCVGPGLYSLDFAPDSSSPCLHALYAREGFNTINMTRIVDLAGRRGVVFAAMADTK